MGFWHKFRQWRRYWSLAWRERPPVKLVSLSRALPSVLITIIVFVLRFRKQQPLKQALHQTWGTSDMWTLIVITIVVYMGIYMLATIGNVVAISPMLMDQKGIGVRTRQQERQLESVRQKTRRVVIRRKADCDLHFGSR
jgi:heme/copper-type cytochrome/quinol oxidase subunit 2